MGVWSTPFETTKQAERFAKLIDKRRVFKEADERTLYATVGCDELWDMMEEFKGGDVKGIVVDHVERWLDDLEGFKTVDAEALAIVKKAVARNR